MRQKILVILIALSVFYTSNAIPTHASSLIEPLLIAEGDDSSFVAIDSGILGFPTHSIDANSIDIKSRGGAPKFGLMGSRIQLSSQEKFINFLSDNFYDFRYYPSIETLNMHKRIATRIIQEKNKNLQSLAQSILNFGDLFERRSLDWETNTKKKFVIPCINEALEVLEESSLKPRERLWIVGILLRIKTFFSKESRFYLKDFRDGYHVSRGEAEISLLTGQEKAIDAELAHMFDSRNGHQDMNISNQVLREPLERIKIINQFKMDILESNPSFTPTKLIKEIHDDLLRLSVPLKFSDSKNLLENIKLLILDDHSTQFEKEFADHIFCDHIWVFHAQEQQLWKATKLSENPLFWKKEMFTRAVWKLRSISRLSETPSILKPFENFKTLKVDDFQNALSELNRASGYAGVRILYALSTAAWLRQDLYEIFKEFVLRLSPVPLNLAKILKTVYPDLNPEVYSKTNFFDLIFHLGNSIIASSRRVILENMLLEKNIVQPELLEKYQDIKWTTPPSDHSQFNNLLSTLMVVFQEKRLTKRPDDKLLLFEYMIGVKSYASNGSEHMKNLLQNEIKDRTVECEFFKQAEKSTLISGISPGCVQKHIFWAQGLGHLFIPHFDQSISSMKCIIQCNHSRE
ncbi:uncharacterized protein MELLADRAFT_104919 [Melampsora larici-populina 98AG31]|uniref:Secreted protein n=1 Tax=Melampsora larici-populina (strain 98AG31 / pathotype 3-4-7) TaxID=747676 RepID=F4RGI5_MELLP|nr:uncharacterized protein MELLADRAFT_104919 [Melampsora larici-populina 98AG31]EGG08642.1 hypothetical protein MELLADRAFT_104919 [Melampsora larici-populina 98AG31]